MNILIDGIHANASEFVSVLTQIRGISIHLSTGNADTDRILQSIRPELAIFEWENPATTRRLMANSLMYPNTEFFLYESRGTGSPLFELTDFRSRKPVALS